jgi:uncharacterized protein (DUF305 family)
MKSLITVGVAALTIGLGVGYVVAKAKQSVPAAHTMETTMDSMTTDLRGKTGVAFEKAFIDGMITHHEGAVAMARMVLVQSERPELVQLAHDIISAQTKEITMMTQWKSQWFDATSTNTTHDTH